MANEATLVVETELPYNFTCANGTGIEKGAVCKMTEPLTAVLSDGDNDVFAGIVASEKIASNGITSVSLYRGGIFEMTINGTCSAGDALVTDSSTGGSNKLATAAINEENVVGVALEDASDEERILVLIKPTTMNLA